MPQKGKGSKYLSFPLLRSMFISPAGSCTIYTTTHHSHLQTIFKHVQIVLIYLLIYDH